MYIIRREHQKYTIYLARNRKTVYQTLSSAREPGHLHTICLQNKASRERESSRVSRASRREPTLSEALARSTTSERNPEIRTRLGQKLYLRVIKANIRLHTPTPLNRKMQAYCTHRTRALRYYIRGGTDTYKRTRQRASARAIRVSTRDRRAQVTKSRSKRGAFGLIRASRLGGPKLGLRVSRESYNLKMITPQIFTSFIKYVITYQERDLQPHNSSLTKSVKACASVNRYS